MYSKYDFGESKAWDKSSFALGLLIGASLGAVAAILFAPQSGTDTRQQLKDLAGQQKDNLSNQWEQTKEEAANLAGTVRDKIQDATSQAKDEANDLAEKVKSSIEDPGELGKTTADKFQKRG